MTTSIQSAVAWTKVGIVAGYLACTVYPLLLAVPMPTPITLALAAAFGPLLTVACIGLYHFISVHRKTLTLQLATVFCVIAGTLVNTMLVVQMTVRESMRLDLMNPPDAQTAEMMRVACSGADKVQLGLDISWDIYLSLGTILFAVNMFRHPRLGRALSVLGVLIGATLLAVNLSTFPVPPGEGVSIDFGPLVGLWYLAVTVMLTRSVTWLRARDQDPAGRSPALQAPGDDR